jgi:hypothetical protein
MGKVLLFSLQNTVDYYNISINSFFYDSFENYLCRFYWGKHCSFPHKTFLIATTFFFHRFFSFQNYLCRIFFNNKLVENLSL